MTHKWSVAARFMVLLLVSAWVTLVCWDAYTQYKKEIDRPPSDYIDMGAQEGFAELTQVAHATATANAFFVTTTVRSLPVLLFGVSIFWLLGQVQETRR
jgi:hypothetical protein